MTLQIVGRADWLAASPTSPGTRVDPGDLLGMVVHWNGPKMGLVDIPHTDRCAKAVKGIQRYHQQSQGWSDVAYSYLSCPHGVGYEGRGEFNQFANGVDQVAPFDRHTPWLTVCILIGRRDDGTDELVDGRVLGFLEELRAQWVRRGMGLRVSPHGTGDDGKAGPAGAFKRKSCPGAQLIEWCEAMNGRPLTPTPPPPPVVVPPSEEDETMVIARNRDTGGAVLLIGSAVRGLGPVGYQQALDQGVPQLDVPGDEWHHLTGL